MYKRQTDVYLVTIIIGSVASLLLFALNMRGLAAAATVQKVLCFILVGAAIIGAVAALIGGDAENWQPIYDVSDPTIYGPASEAVYTRQPYASLAWLNIAAARSSGEIRRLCTPEARQRMMPMTIQPTNMMLAVLPM